MMIHMVEISNKMEEYRGYIMEHRDNINKAWIEMQAKPKIVHSLSYIDGAIEDLNRRAEQHDLSKYTIEEFNAYRQYFYPCEHEKKDKIAFEFASKHHYEHNDHHWQHWLNEDGTFKYSKSKVIVGLGETTKLLAYTEMVLDWTAIGYRVGDTALQYYQLNKDEIKIDPYYVEYTHFIEMLAYEMSK